jgi:hypothetical protein
MDGRRYVQDFDAPGGTMLNGNPIHRAALQPGDEVHIGKVSLRYALIKGDDDLIEPVIDPSIDEPVSQDTPSADDSDAGDMPTFDLGSADPETEHLFDVELEQPIDDAVEDSLIPLTEPQSDADAPEPEPEQEEPEQVEPEQTEPEPAQQAEASESSPPDPAVEQISELVEEVAEKAEELKAAWNDYQSEQPSAPNA